MPPTPPPSPSGPHKPASSAPGAPPSGHGDPSDGLDFVKQQLGQITQLSDDELQDLGNRILALIDSYGTGPGDPNDPPDLQASGALSILASATQQLRSEVSRRGRYKTNRATLAEFSNSAGGGGAGTGPAQLTARDVPGGHRAKRSRGMGAATAVTASGNPVHDMAGIAEEFATAIRQQRSPTSRNGRSHIVSVKTSLGGDRTLPGDDPTTVTAALDAAVEEHVARVSDVLTAIRTGNAITAAGGLGAPEQSDYVLAGFSVPDRPVKSALPGFTTERGGVRFTRPPALSDLDGAIGLWTVADDIAAATDTSVRKPSYRVATGPEVVVNVQAITNSLIFGNMVARAYPEFVTEATNLSLAAQARIGEQQLLTGIGALSTHVTGGVENLGATRLFLRTLERAAYGMRDRLRMPDSGPLQLILPHWTRGLLRSDLTAQEPGDSVTSVSNSDVDAYFAALNLQLTYALDGEAGQNFDPQVLGPVNDWPDRVVSYLFPAGAFQFLDGGTLDLGLVHDSQLNAANDFQMFVETFEAVMWRGGTSMRITQPMTPSGIARAAA